MAIVTVGENESNGATARNSGSRAENPVPSPMNREPVESGSFDPRNPGPPPWPNELEPNVSHNNIITLSQLTPHEVNYPKAFRENGPSINILRSGGGVEKPKTAAEQAFGINTEFFIDDFEMQTIIKPDVTTGNTNVTSLTFTVHEPYSMGMFIETLRLAARKAGYAHHTDAPYLLTLEFIGWDENNRPLKNQYSKRMIPIRIQNMEFEVTQGGSVYSVRAIAWNELAYGDDVQNLQVDTTITGRTVQEILQSGLQSLTSVVNTRELEKVESEQKLYGDQYVIAFPLSENREDSPIPQLIKNESAIRRLDRPLGDQREDLLFQSVRGSNADLNDLTDEEFDNYLDFRFEQTGKIEPRSNLGEQIRDFAENPFFINSLGETRIIEDWLQLGESPLGNEGLAYDEENAIYRRNGAELTLSDDLRTFKFKQGTKIQDVIEEVLLASTYAKQLYEQLKNPPNDGLVDWFKIETQTFLLADNEALKKTGKYPKIYLYRVVPFKTHIHVFKAPTSSSEGISEVKKEAVKQYEYIYTGKNADILDFSINYSTSYLAPIRSDKGQSGERTKAQDGAVHQESSATPTANEGGGEVPAEGPSGTRDISENKTNRDGGTSNEPPEVVIAKGFNDILLNSPRDLIRLDITIMGDPFYISDSGLGNYNAGDTSYSGINTDGAMNAQNGEVFINLLFRTPIDYNPDTGLMIFPDQTEIVNSFSGLYQVRQVTNSISGNEFKQTLSIMRILGQEDSPPQSLIKEGGREQSILGNQPGGVFDESPPSTDPEAVADLVSVAGSTLQTNVLAAQRSFNRLLAGGADFLTIGIDGATSLVNDLIGNLNLPVNVDIPDGFISQDLLDQLALGSVDLESVVTGLIRDQVGDIDIGNIDIPGLGGASVGDIGNVVPLDPEDTLSGLGGD